MPRHEQTITPIPPAGLDAADLPYRLLVENAPDGVFVNVRQRIVYANPAMLRMVGKSAAQLIGSSPLELWHPDARPLVMQRIQSLFAGQTTLPPQELRLLRSDGSEMEVETIPTRFEHHGEAAIQVFVRDLTHRKAAEAQRRVLIELCDAAPQPICIANADHTVHYMNRASLRLARLPEDFDYRSARIPDFYPPDVARMVLTTALPTAAREGSWSGETVLQRRDGSTVPLYQVIVAHRLPSGAPAFYSTIVHDLSDVKRQEQALERRVSGRTADLLAANAALATEIKVRQDTEEALRVSQRRLEEAQRIAHVGDWVWDIRSNELTWSAEIYRIFGLDPATFTPTYASFLTCVHPADRARVEQAVEHALQSRTPYEAQHRIVRPDGGQRYVHERAEITTDSEGRAWRMVGTVQDITQIKKAEHTLRAVLEGTSAATGRRFFESLVQHLTKVLGVRAAMVAAFTGPDNERMKVLAACADHELLDPGEMPATTCPCGGVVAHYFLHVHGGALKTYPHNPLLTRHQLDSCMAVALCSATGRVIGVLAVLDPNPIDADAMRTGMLNIFGIRAAAELDRLQSEERAQKHWQELAHVARVNALGGLTAGLAHELNQPLCAISNYARSAIRRLRDAPVDAEILEDISRCAGQAERAAEIIRRLRLLMSKRETRRSAVDLNELVVQALPLMEPSVREAGARLELQLAPNLPAIMGDAVQIEQVLHNLVINAVEAMEQTPPAQRIVRIETAKLETGVRLRVTDRGPGVPAEMLPRLAQSFFTTKPHGMGLGLSICDTIVTLHEGKLLAENAPGGGLQVTVELPLGSNALRG